jgi:hypothetical protein
MGMPSSGGRSKGLPKLSFDGILVVLIVELLAVNTYRGGTIWSLGHLRSQLDSRRAVDCQRVQGSRIRGRCLERSSEAADLGGSARFKF